MALGHPAGEPLDLLLKDAPGLRVQLLQLKSLSARWAKTSFCLSMRLSFSCRSSRASMSRYSILSGIISWSFRLHLRASLRSDLPSKWVGAQEPTVYQRRPDSIGDVGLQPPTQWHVVHSRCCFQDQPLSPCQTAIQRLPASISSISLRRSFFLIPGRISAQMISMILSVRSRSASSLIRFRLLGSAPPCRHCPRRSVRTGRAS